MHSILLFLLAAISFLGAVTTYKDEGAKYTVDYPANWEKQDLPAYHTIAFLRPKVVGDYFQENVNIMQQDLSTQPMTLKEFTDFSREQIKKAQGFGKIVSDKPLALAGLQASEMTYTMVMGPMTLQMWQIWFVKGKTAFVFTYTGRVEEFDKYLPQAKGVINSFKFY